MSHGCASVISGTARRFVKAIREEIPFSPTLEQVMDVQNGLALLQARRPPVSAGGARLVVIACGRLVMYEFVQVCLNVLLLSASNRLSTATQLEWFQFLVSRMLYLRVTLDEEYGSR